MSDKLESLRAQLADLDRVLIAYSGGVDSSFLLRVACEQLQGRVTALTVQSPTAAERELADAAAVTAALGVEHLVIPSNELEIPGYAENPIDRCFLCKGNLYEICGAAAEQRQIGAIMDGVNLDDLGDYRPGLRAAAARGIRHPLADARMTKEDIRRHSRELGLPTWDKPASPCLSSRFPYGTRITLERLSQIGEAERLLQRLGFRQCRVRYHEQVARIEVPPAEMARLLADDVRAEITAVLKRLGFAYVTLDLQGFRSGSLNEVLRSAAPTTPPIPDPPES